MPLRSTWWIAVSSKWKSDKCPLKPVRDLLFGLEHLFEHLDIANVLAAGEATAGKSFGLCALECL